MTGCELRQGRSKQHPIHREKKEMKAEKVNESIALLDFTPEIKCESMFHVTDPSHEGAAEFFQHGPCAGSTGYRCGGYVRSLTPETPFHPCEYCGVRHEMSNLSFTPLSAN